jgi:predicted  nucleic acid-binding Zn-ribbon protein
MKKEFDAERAFDKMFKYMQDMDKRLNTRIDSEIGGISQRLDTLQDSMDYLVGEYQKLSDEQTAEISSHDRFEEKLDDHETRIGQLENLELGQQTL